MAPRRLLLLWLWLSMSQRFSVVVWSSAFVCKPACGNSPHTSMEGEEEEEKKPKEEEEKEGLGGVVCEGERET